MPFWDDFKAYLEEKGVEYEITLGGKQKDTAWIIELYRVPDRIVDELLLPMIRRIAREDFFYVNNVKYDEKAFTIITVSFGNKKWK